MALTEDVPFIAVTVGIILGLVLLGFYLSWRATRLHRLHHRVDVARAGLEAALVRRRAAVLALAAAETGPEASGKLSGAVMAARDAREAQRDLAESTLSRVLRDVLASPGPFGSPAPPRAHLTEVESAAKGVHMARTFYNDAVAETRRARRSKLVRGFRLAGTAPLPDFFEIDDQPPRLPFPTAEPDTL